MDPDREREQQANSPLRASDADREQTIEALAAASAEGRLSLEEYSQRSDAALAARTLGELTGLTTDLPAPPRADLAPVPVEITAVLGNESRKGPWVVPEHITVRSVLGDCHLEMQQAVIRQHVTTIDAKVRFGAMTIFVPDGIDVRMHGRAVLGAKSSQLRAGLRLAGHHRQLRRVLRVGNRPPAGLDDAAAAGPRGQALDRDQGNLGRSHVTRRAPRGPRSWSPPR